MRGHPDFEFMLRRQRQLSESDRDAAFCVPGSTRVLFAESNRMVAEALMFAVDVEPSLEPIGYALEGWEALELAESLRPDVIVVGPHLEGLDSLTLTRLVNECWPSVHVVVLAEAHVPDQLGQAHAAGAAECVPLDRSADELIDAIAAAAKRPARLAAVGDV